VDFWSRHLLETLQAYPSSIQTAALYLFSFLSEPSERWAYHAATLVLFPRGRISQQYWDLVPPWRLAPSLPSSRSWTGYVSQLSINHLGKSSMPPIAAGGTMYSQTRPA
jgi:hypothetical protein